MNAVLNSESLDSGGAEADYRMRCNADGGVRVDTFAGPPATTRSRRHGRAAVDGARAACATRPTRATGEPTPSATA